jgi:hypothetical protein
MRFFNMYTLTFDDNKLAYKLLLMEFVWGQHRILSGLIAT